MPGNNDITQLDLPTSTLNEKSVYQMENSKERFLILFLFIES